MPARTYDKFQKKCQPSLPLCSIALMYATASVSNAADFSPITAQVEITYLDGQQYFETYSYSTAQEFSDTIDHKIINNPAYDRGIDLPQLLANSDVQGNAVVMTSASNSTQITLTSESLGIHETFDGGSRKASARLLETWVKDNTGIFFKKVNAQSTLSTIGGVSGYLPRTPGLDGSIDGSGTDANVLKELAGTERESHLSILTGFASYNAKDRSADVYSLPINYDWELNKGWALLFNVPLTYIDTNGISSYSGSIGTGLRIPVSNYVKTGKLKWDLVPLFRVGAIGSEQNNIESSIIFSGGLQSNLGIPLTNGYAMVVQNQYTYYAVESIKAYTDALLNNTSLDIPAITNSIFRNSVQLVKDFDYQLFGRTVMADISFADTRISGTKLAIDNQQEIGFDIGLRAASKEKPDLKSMETVSEVMAFDRQKLEKKARAKLAATEFKINFKYTIAAGIDSAYSFNASVSF